MAPLTLNKEGKVVESRLKYGNKITLRDGIKFRSAGEANRYLELKLMQQVGEISELKLQVKHKLEVNGIVVGTYTSDFEYIEDGQWVVEDFKGARTALFILKWNTLKAMHRECLGMTFRLTGKTNKERKNGKKADIG